MRGIKKLNKSISAVVAPFGITSAKVDTSYSYDFWTHEITFQPRLTEDDKYFSTFIEQYFKMKDEMPVLLSLLHEIGHHKTYKTLTEEEWDFCEERKEKIFKKIQKAKTKKGISKLQNEYFRLPDEIRATKWAVNFIKKHPKKARIMNIEIERAFNEFYRTNGIRGRT